MNHTGPRPATETNSDIESLEEDEIAIGSIEECTGLPRPRANTERYNSAFQGLSTLAGLVGFPLKYPDLLDTHHPHHRRFRKFANNPEYFDVPLEGNVL